MILCGAFQVLAGTWYIPPNIPAATVKDINGVILNIGDTVKIVGTIINIIQRDLQTGDIAIQPIHPLVNLPVIQLTSLGTVKGL